MLAYVVLQLMLSGATMDFGRATVYWPGDNHCGPIKATGKLFLSIDSHIAHRSIPLYTRGTVCNVRTKLCAKTRVEDRGPFGQIIRCNKYLGLTDARKIRWNNKCYYWTSGVKLVNGWEWRGKFDITKPIADVIKLRPFDYVVFIYKRRGNDKDSYI